MVMTFSQVQGETWCSAPGNVRVCLDTSQTRAGVMFMKIVWEDVFHLAGLVTLPVFSSVTSKTGKLVT